jgi:hypothetical protein
MNRTTSRSPLLVLPLVLLLPLGLRAEEPNPQWLARCEKGEKVHPKLPKTFTPGRCCYLVAAHYQKTDPVKALRFSKKACALKDNLGCVVYAKVAADPDLATADYVRAREHLVKLCAAGRILDSRGTSDETGVVCYTAALTLYSPDEGQSFPVSPGEKRQAKTMLDAACKVRHPSACEMALHLERVAGRPAKEPVTPKTRTIDQADNLAEAVVEELKAGRTDLLGKRGTIKPGPACLACAKRCQPKVVPCLGGEDAACYDAARCFCACMLAAKGCGHPMARLEECVAEASEKGSGEE